jgi:hypothetical protein
MMSTGLLMASSLLSLSSASGYELVQTEAFQPTKSSIIGYVPIEDEMHFELDVVVHSWPESTWENFFHCGSSNSIRYPGVWLHPSSASEGFRMHIPSEPGWVGAPLVLGDTYHIEMEYTQSWLSVTINGESVYDASKSSHTTYDSQPVYGSDPWYDAADVTVSNIVIWSGADEPTTTGEPTEDPSAAPTTEPSMEPTLSPSAEPTNDPTRDCSVFHIDEFLMDCSVEFDGHDTNIRTLQDDVSSVTKAMGDNAVDIATLQATVANLVTAATTMADSIDKINDELALVIEALDRMGDWP